MIAKVFCSNGPFVSILAQVEVRVPVQVLGFRWFLGYLVRNFLRALYKNKIKQITWLTFDE